MYLKLKCIGGLETGRFATSYEKNNLRQEHYYNPFIDKTVNRFPDLEICVNCTSFKILT